MRSAGRGKRVRQPSCGSVRVRRTRSVSWQYSLASKQEYEKKTGTETLAGEKKVNEKSPRIYGVGSGPKLPSNKNLGTKVHKGKLLGKSDDIYVSPRTGE